MDGRNKRKAEIETRLKSLPKGYISRKVISGKERLYLQWREEGKIRSRYIKEAEKEQILAAVAERKALEREMLQLNAPKYIFEQPSLDTGMMAAEEVREYHVRPSYYLKWKDTVIGEVDDEYNVRFISPDLNETVKKYAPDTDVWSRDDFVDFLQGRIVSQGRRDIEKILYRCGLTVYDPVEIGIRTKAVSAQDLLWITDDRNEKFDEALTEVFDSVFMKGEDLQGDSVDTPEGQNIKRYGVFEGKYGIYKERLTPLSTDVESEIAVAAIAERLGVPCCHCWRTDVNTVFSAFQYDFANEYIVHFRQLIKKRTYEDDFQNLIAARPGYLDSFVKMIALDFITRQDDRHFSNIAVRITEAGEEFYPLYDNGRSLFYEDTEETVRRACGDVKNWSTAFGPAGSYFDHVRSISDMGISFRKLLDLDITEKEVKKILTDAGFTRYRLEGSIKWIMKCLDVLKDLG